MKIPDYVKKIIERLEAAGYEAYIVGGCVRDSLLGLEPSDYDITTSATPDEVKAVFAELSVYSVHDTGIKHGTVTVGIAREYAEVTTFRIDGEYSDNRRPDNVVFTRNLQEDLSRRDFTVNAMAYSEKSGIVDYFGGQDDLEKKVIRAVGNPEKRFNEDGLRILRALRFAAVYDFSIEENTAAAIHQLRRLIQNVAGERIAAELNKLVCGKVSGVVWEFCDVFAEFIPEIAVCKGFEQHSVYHDRDVLTHILNATDNSPKDKVTRLAMLFHDLGKPPTFELRDGAGHFTGHPTVSKEIAHRVLKKLKYDNDTRRKVVKLVMYHDIPITTNKKRIKMLLNHEGEDMFFKLIDVHAADDSAKAEMVRRRIPEHYKAAEIARKIIADDECFSLKQLAVKGGDLVELGYKGGEIGDKLNKLLQMVIDGECENDKSELLGKLV